MILERLALALSDSHAVSSTDVSRPSVPVLTKTKSTRRWEDDVDDKRTTMGQAGRDLAEKEFGVDQVISQTLSIYRRLLGNDTEPSLSTRTIPL